MTKQILESSKQEHYRIAVLDDYQHVALSLADWSVLDGRATVTVFNDHLADSDAVAEDDRGQLRGEPLRRQLVVSDDPAIPVSIGPGATAFTRTLAEAASTAAVFVSPSTACLVAA
jgi:hypothetical protein